MQKQTKVSFVPQSTKVNLRTYSYSIIAEDEKLAIIVAEGLLEQDTKYFALYRPICKSEVAYNV